MAISFRPSGTRWRNLGALGFFFYWIVTASGIYVYIFFDTGITEAYDSVDWMTHDNWYAAGVMRSLHRYASDALVVVMLLHLVRELANDRYRGVRWFSWIIGVPILVLVYVAGITGYWMVWDQLGQYVAVVSTEWLDQLPIFGDPIARNFHMAENLDDRFFTLMVFIHIAVPLIALILLWIHLQRIAKPRINPPRGLAIGSFAAMLALSLVYPATSHAPADLGRVPADLGLDWFYLPLFPLMESLPGPVTWGAALVLLVILGATPWLPPMKRPPAAVVDLANCNGCTRCVLDCPYNALAMVARTDGRPFEREARVDPSYCVSCGICAGSCPTAMPFRRASALVAGIDLPQLTVGTLRGQVEAAAAELSGRSRIMVFSCVPGVDTTGLGDDVGIVSLRCIGQLPPSFIDFVLSRNLADGVLLAGCEENACRHRLGIRWTEARLEGRRDPHLRNRVPRERLFTLWAGRLGRRELEKEISRIREALVALPSPSSQPATVAAHVAAHVAAMPVGDGDG